MISCVETEILQNFVQTFANSHQYFLFSAHSNCVPTIITYSTAHHTIAHFKGNRRTTKLVSKMWSKNCENWRQNLSTSHKRMKMSRIYAAKGSTFTIKLTNSTQVLPRGYEWFQMSIYLRSYSKSASNVCLPTKKLVDYVNQPTKTLRLWKLTFLNGFQCRMQP